MATTAPACSGLHLVEWGCEFLGTALLLLGGTLAVCLGFHPSSPLVNAVHSSSARLLITGTLFAGTGSLVALTPFGRKSGAHLNPAVTVAFWLNKHLHWHDLAGYIAAQFLGAVFTSSVLALAVHSWVHPINYAVTRPGAHTNVVTALFLETVMTLALILLIFTFVSSPKTARWTPLGVWIMVALLVWRVAPYTGTSLNPARSFGPALVSLNEKNWSDYWIYVVGPVLGAFTAAALWIAIPRETLTAKLFHDPRFTSTMRSKLPTSNPSN